MVTFVSADWVQQRLDAPGFLIIDPRSVIRYMSGHAKHSGPNHQFLVPREKLLNLFADYGISTNDQVVAYCHSGVRASLGFLALAHLGIPVSLYDGSYAEWARNELPVKHSEVPAQT